MANSLQLNRRLLLAILRTPSIFVSSRSQSSGQLLSTRYISTSSRYHTAPSVSFGEETDQLIAALEPQKAKSPSKKRLPRTKTLDDSNERSEKRSGNKLLRQLSENIERIERQKKEDVIANGIQPETDTTIPGNKQDETKQKTRRTRTPIKEKRARNAAPRVAETKPIAVPTADSEVYDTPVLLEIPDPNTDSIPPFESTHKPQPTPPVRNSPKRSSQPSPPPSTPQPSTLRLPGSEPWQIQKHALRQKFTEGWQPRKKLSPDTLIGIRSLHERDPLKFSTENLARQFAVSPEAIRRILRTKWGMTPEKMDERRERWAKRHDRIWDHKAELGQRPARTREKKIEGPEKFEELVLQKQVLGEM